ncbi:MAG: GatB/YqeY domain-containing protein, partial [Candidatus Pacebacteria bacterium]|nr:GatB/YqeY domain-containing protein [Candidatus Paceibacterota bacterium]
GEQADTDVQEIISKLVKQWQDALTDFQKANREDLIKETKQKIQLLQQYLPQQLSDQELTKIIKEVIKTSDQTQAGPIIGQVMAKVKGQADGSRVAKLVKQSLS